MTVAIDPLSSNTLLLRGSLSNAEENVGDGLTEALLRRMNAFRAGWLRHPEHRALDEGARGGSTP